MAFLRRWIWLALCASLFSIAQLPGEDDLVVGRIRAGRRQSQQRLAPDPGPDTGVLQTLSHLDDAVADLPAISVLPLLESVNSVSPAALRRAVRRVPLTGSSRAPPEA